MDSLWHRERENKPSKYGHLRKTPDRGLADILGYWARDLVDSNFKNEVSLMLSITFLLGSIAFGENTPFLLLQVDPTLVLQPEKVQLLKKAVLHMGCQPLDVGIEKRGMYVRIG